MYNEKMKMIETERYPMRLRNIRGSREAVAVSHYVIHQEETRADAWNSVFGNKNPIHIEIGMGKGKFLY